MKDFGSTTCPTYEYSLKLKKFVEAWYLSMNEPAVFHLVCSQCYSLTATSPFLRFVALIRDDSDVSMVIHQLDIMQAEWKGTVDRFTRSSGSSKSSIAKLMSLTVLKQWFCSSTCNSVTMVTAVLTCSSCAGFTLSVIIYIQMYICRVLL